MKKTKKGYMVEYKPNHPCSPTNGWVYKHRLIMEEKLGRLLTKDEVIHHIDGNKVNNDINNLKLFSTHSEHIKYHMSNGWSERLSKFWTGRKHSQEAKEKCKISKIGNKHCVGRKYSSETILKMKESQRIRREGERYAAAY